MNELPEDEWGKFLSRVSQAKYTKEPVETCEKNMSILLRGSDQWKKTKYFWFEGVRIVLRGCADEIKKAENVQLHQLLHGDTSVVS